MTPDEHQILMARMRGTWPGDWDEERCLVWGEAFEEYAYPVAVAAVRRMARECEFPSIASFTRFARGGGPGEVVVDGERMFLPGGGWIPYPAPDRYVMPAIERAREPGDAEIVPLEDSRRRWEEARRRIVKRPPKGGQEVS
jgi:hypothetical protein